MLLAVLTIAAPAARPQSETTAGDPIHAAWQQALPGMIALAMAPDGARVAALEASGRLRCFDAEGNLAWTAAAEGADRLAMSAGGRRVVAYALQQPLHTTLALFGAAGEALGELEAEGPVAAVALAGDGSRLAVGSGTRVHVWHWGRRGTREQAFDLPTEVAQLLPAPGDTLYVALRGGGVRRVRPDGHSLWEVPGEGTGTATLSATPDGRLLASAGHAPGEAETIRLRVREAAGRVRWEFTWPGRLPRLRLVPTGAAVVVAYEQPERHGESVRYERRLGYFPADPPARMAWASGGAFTGASLFAAAAADGHFVVSLDVEPRAGTMNLRLLTAANGQKMASYTSPSPVRLAAAAQDGSSIALYREDGQLALVRVLAGDQGRQ
jgi:hypothetical protein